MAAPEWAELDSLTQAIADLRVRQEAAKSVESHDLAATIEQEIAQLEERRNQILAQLAQGVVTTGGPNHDSVTANHVNDEAQRTERASAQQPVRRYVFSVASFEVGSNRG